MKNLVHDLRFRCSVCAQFSKGKIWAKWHLSSEVALQSTVKKHVNEETHKMAIKFFAQKEEGTKFWKEQVQKLDHETINKCLSKQKVKLVNWMAYSEVSLTKYPSLLKTVSSLDSSL